MKVRVFIPKESVQTDGATERRDSQAEIRVWCIEHFGTPCDIGSIYTSGKFIGFVVHAPDENAAVHIKLRWGGADDPFKVNSAQPF